MEFLRAAGNRIAVAEVLVPGVRPFDAELLPNIAINRVGLEVLIEIWGVVHLFCGDFDGTAAQRPQCQAA